MFDKTVTLLFIYGILDHAHAAHLDRPQQQQQQQQQDSTLPSFKARYCDIPFYLFDKTVKLLFICQFSRSAIYIHADGSNEEVQILKTHSDAEGSGYTIRIPSTGVERQTVAQRLLHLDGSSFGGDPVLLIGSFTSPATAPSLNARYCDVQVITISLIR